MAASEPTSPLSWAKDTLCPLALSRHFGTLTPGWVVPLSDMELTPMPRLPASTAMTGSEFDREAEDFSP